ncbi:MAG: hypothetical protein RLY93_20455 [Sumerlaeia bacterium]
MTPHEKAVQTLRNRIVGLDIQGRLDFETWRAAYEESESLATQGDTMNLTGTILAVAKDDWLDRVGLGMEAILAALGIAPVPRT